MLAYQYLEEIGTLIKTLRETQMEAIHTAASAIAPKLEKGGILYAFGTGHSHILALDITNRAGGLVQTKAIVPYELAIDPNPNKTMLMERMDGLAAVIFETNTIRQQDALILISNSGRNAVPIQMAMEAKKRGIFTVALTNLAHSQSVTSRDKSGKKLYELCDVVLDICGKPGDTIMTFPGKNWSTGPVSTIAGSALLQALVCETMEIMIADGVDPTILQSMNLDGNDDYNKNAVESLYNTFPALKVLLHP